MQYLVLAFSHKHPQLADHSDNITLLTQLAEISVISEAEQQCLAANYCKLRDFGHHATLKNTEQMIKTELFNSEYQEVLPIIAKILR